MKRVALVVKRSKLDLYKEKREGYVEGLMAAGDPTVRHIEAAHREHTETVEETLKALSELGVDVTRMRGFRKGFDASEHDLVVTVGGDGTLLHASHSVGDTPTLAINSAPSHSVGFFCGAARGGVLEALKEALRGKAKRALLTRMQVKHGDDIVSARVLNDALFCHRSPAATSRYIVEFDGVEEEHKSSGFWIGPAAGSTAAQRSAGGEVLPLGSKKLQLVVREPYTPNGRPLRCFHALVRNGQTLRVRSKSQHMRIYIDGPDRMHKIDLGDVVEFTQAPEPLHLLGISSRRKWEG